MRVLDSCFDVLIRELKIAAEREGQVRDFGLQFVEECLVSAPVVLVTSVGVRGSDDIGDAILPGKTAHFEGRGPVLRPVIETGEDVTVKIDHQRISPLSRHFSYAMDFHVSISTAKCPDWPRP